jgi:hypothetical protein
MKQSGRTHPLILVAALGVVVVLVLLMFSGESLTAVGAQFLSALAKGDAKTLTDLSYLDNKSKDEVQKEWEASVSAAKHYRFQWKIVAANQADERTASIKIQVTRNSDSPGAYEENYGLPLVKVDGHWKVIYTNLGREMSPFLPRSNKN